MLWGESSRKWKKGVDWKILSIRKKQTNMLSGFSHSKCSEHLNCLILEIWGENRGKWKKAWKPPWSQTHCPLFGSRWHGFQHIYLCRLLGQMLTLRRSLSVNWWWSGRDSVRYQFGCIIRSSQKEPENTTIVLDPAEGRNPSKHWSKLF